jgi:predicted GH43/DUF377 family glycosyl hydrolase
MKFKDFAWQRDPTNPILPPREPYDSGRCMNPFALVHNDELWLYYSGAGTDGHQKICLAVAPLDNPTAFVRRGVVLDNGSPGAFDAHWCVLPCLHRINDRWHLYYSGHEGSKLGLQSFPGIGLALSDDGVHFTRYREAPLITGDQTAEFPQNRGIAGGGSIIEDVLPDGGKRYRMYYTLATGTTSKDVFVDQEKHCAVCHSDDGIHWHDHRLVLSPRRQVTNEDIAVAAPFVFRDGDVYRMVYCGIGSRWGFYSISQAVSSDGYAWERGEGDANLTLMPGTAEWEKQMVEYPSIIHLQDRWRLFYCGNGYGQSGIGTALSKAH